MFSKNGTIFQKLIRRLKQYINTFMANNTTRFDRLSAIITITTDIQPNILCQD